MHHIIKIIFLSLTGLLFTQPALAHVGEHGGEGFLFDLLHHLTAADHGLLFLLIAVCAGLYILIRRHS